MKLLRTLLASILLCGGVAIAPVQTTQAAGTFTPDLGYFATYAALVAAYPPASVPLYTTAKTGDSGPVWNNGTTWVTVSGYTTSAGSSQFGVDVVIPEALTPFSTWTNVKTACGAVGNGTTDDTAAIQGCLNAMSGAPTGVSSVVLYFPAGTYKLTSGLTWTGMTNTGAAIGWGGLAIVGADPATTTIKWAGGTGANMLTQNGGAGYRYERLTWDCSSTANVIGVAHWWNTTSGVFSSGSFIHQDEVFKNCYIGIMGGRLGTNFSNLDSEGLVRRVTFQNMAYAGLDTGSFNALDWWVWDSTFTTGARALSSKYSVNDSGTTVGAGNFLAYRNYFAGSTTADFDIQNTQWFSLHQNVSIGSAKFMNAEFQTTTGQAIVEGNRVSGAAATAVTWSNFGPLLFVDNTIQATALYSESQSSADAILLGNALTGTIPAASGTQRQVSFNNTTVSTVSNTAPAMPATPGVTTHTVYEVASTDNTAQIQTKINSACVDADGQAIVHFGGSHIWTTTSTLSTPVNCHAQLVGDSWMSMIQWGGAGAGTMLTINCPAKVIVRDLQFLAFSPTAKAIAMGSGCDTAGGRIQIVSSTNGDISASNLVSTGLAMQANPYIGVMTLNNVAHAHSIGAGPSLDVNLSNNSSYVMNDTWREGTATAGPQFTIANGYFTYLGGQYAPAAHGGTQPAGPITVNGGTATAMWAAMRQDLLNVTGLTGVIVQNEVAGTNPCFIADSSSANGGTQNGWFNRTGSGGDVAFVINWQTSGQYTNTGDQFKGGILNCWAQQRALPWRTVTPYTPPNGATDIRIYHIKADQSLGYTITG